VDKVIEHPEAYERATNARIRANANKTFRELNPDWAQIEDLLSKGRDGFSYKETFIGSLCKGYDIFGKLSDKQIAIVRSMIEKNQLRAEEAKKQRILQAANSKHVGTVGEKIELIVEVKHIAEFNSAIRYSYYDSGLRRAYIMVDADGNSVVVFSADLDMTKGKKYNISAKVKAHNVRDGEAQTILQRVKIKNEILEEVCA